MKTGDSPPPYIWLNSEYRAFWTSTSEAVEKKGAGLKPAPASHCALPSEYVVVCPGTPQRYNLSVIFPNEKPVKLNVALPAASHITAQSVPSIPGLQRLPFKQLINHVPQQFRVFATSSHSSEVASVTGCGA